MGNKTIRKVNWKDRPENVFVPGNDQTHLNSVQNNSAQSKSAEKQKTIHTELGFKTFDELRQYLSALLRISEVHYSFYPNEQRYITYTIDDDSIRIKIDNKSEYSFKKMKPYSDYI